MEIFRSLSIRYKVLLIPIVAAVGFILNLVISFHNMQMNHETLSQSKSVDFVLFQIAQKSLVNLDKIKETLGDAATTGEAELLEQGKALALELQKELNKAQSVNQQLANQIQQLSEYFNDYFEFAYSLSQSIVDDSVDYATLGKRSGQMSDKLALLQNALNSFKNQRSNSFDQAFKDVESRMDNTNTINLIVGFATIAILFSVAFPVAHSIRCNLTDVINSMRNIAQDNGDLTVRLRTRSQDEIGELVSCFNDFMEKLHSVIKHVVDTVIPLTNTANDIFELSEHSKNTAEQQQLIVEDSKISVDKLSTSVGNISGFAVDAKAAADHANDESHKGKMVVENAVVSIKALHQNISDSARIINELHEDTNKVNMVLDVIGGIAEQTNLLALNAAIEAARAGEQGRGFAVVADEVRGLASRTQESTQQINQMLSQLQSAAKDAVSEMEDSLKQVEASVNNTILAGDSLNSIKKTVDTITTMNKQIAEATEDQEAVSEVMVQHAVKINAKTKETSTAANDLNGVSDQLAGLATELREITNRFKL